MDAYWKETIYRAVPSSITMWHTDKPEVCIYDLFVSMPALMSPMAMVSITAPWGFLLLLGTTCK